MKPGNETRIVPLLFTAEYQILYYTTLIPKPRPPFSCSQHIKAHVSTRSPPTLLYFKSQKTGRGLWTRVKVVSFLDRVAQLPHPFLVLAYHAASNWGSETRMLLLRCDSLIIPRLSLPCFSGEEPGWYEANIAVLSTFFWGGAWLVWGCTLL